MVSVLPNSVQLSTWYRCTQMASRTPKVKEARKRRGWLEVVLSRILVTRFFNLPPLIVCQRFYKIQFPWQDML